LKFKELFAYEFKNGDERANPTNNQAISGILWEAKGR
jgi:hypothetical protein